MPWRNSHWHVQSFVGEAQAMKNGSGPGSTFAGRFDENDIASSPNLLTSPHNLVESDPSRDVTCKAMEWQPELANKGMSLPMSLETDMPASVRGVEVSAQALYQPGSHVQSDECPVMNDPLNQQEELTVEGGTISISSVYSEGCVRSFWILCSAKCISSYKSRT
uniref:Uncharacterized protein n=1 Tax=Rhizophora mucronata TaxID=61149 RepID=A0A2P2JA48_RHIMU